jgi:hypothetical protein
LKRALPSVLAASALLVATTSPAQADEGDGAYGRLKGDTTIVVGVGGGFSPADGRPFLGADLRARYLDAAGAMVFYEEADALHRASEGGALRRAFGAGIELRPLFPIRFLKAYESRHGFFELVLDSVGLDMAAYFSALEGSSVQRPGLHVGLSVEVPLAAVASGPWLRLGAAVRWTSPRLEGEVPPGSRTVALTIGLAWHEVVSSGVVDRHDRNLSRSSPQVPGPSW